jgi:hypothetical protein
MDGPNPTPLDAALPSTWADYLKVYPNPELDGIRVHPAADLFPMDVDGLGELAKDIDEHGLQTQLVWLDGQLLDGRRRVAAIALIPDKARREPLLEYCRNPNRGIRLSGLSVAQAEAYVISLNLNRRHLTLEWRREFAATRLKAHAERSDRSIAKETGVNRTTVGQIRAELEARGDVSIVDTRIDVRGHQRPATKQPKPLGNVTITPIDLSGPLGDVSHKPIDLGLPRSSSKPPPSLPPAKGTAVVGKELADVMARLSALLKVDANKALDAVVRTLKVAKPSIEALPKEKRVAFARGFQRALLLADSDMRPIT